MTVKSIGITAPNATTSTLLTDPDFSQAAVPFLGSATITVPTDTLQKLLCHFPEAKLDPWAGWYAVGCDRQQEDGSLDWTFGNGVIASIPFAELIVKLPQPDGGAPPTSNATLDFNTTCWLGVLDGPFPIQLGAPFMRSHTGKLRSAQWSMQWGAD
jgi:hypothetical protein